MTTLGSASSFAILCNNLTTSGTNTINNNIVKDLINSSPEIGTGTTSSIQGITLSSTTAGVQTVSNNTIENLENIQSKRKEIWSIYYEGLKELENKNFINLPFIPDYASNNAHMFYIQCRNLEDRTRLIAHLKKSQINAVFHYLSLHKSPYYINKHDQRELPNSDFYSDCLLRLPMYYELDVMNVINNLRDED